MKRYLTFSVMVFCALPALADEAPVAFAPRQAEGAAATKPKPDMNAPVKITLTQLERIIAATKAQAEASCAARAASADIEDAIKQATPAEKKP